MSEFVILVDEHDIEIGTCEKMEAHKKALLHRAFSVFLFNDKGEMLLQQRAKEKYHSGGLWTNACCGHPRPNESTLNAASRRLGEEMGIACLLELKFTFTYKAVLDNELTEHEIDHVFFGKYNKQPQLNPEEAKDFKWIPIVDLAKSVEANPEQYTEWFKICLKEVLSNI